MLTEMPQSKSKMEYNFINHLSANDFVALKVVSDVSAPLIISTTFIIGGGFIKCMPMTCSIKYSLSLVTPQITAGKQFTRKSLRQERQQPCTYISKEMNHIEISSSSRDKVQL